MKRIKEHQKEVITRWFNIRIQHELRKAVQAEYAAHYLVNWWGINGPPENTISRDNWNKYVTQKHIDDFKKQQAKRDRIWEDRNELRIGPIQSWPQSLYEQYPACL